MTEIGQSRIPQTPAGDRLLKEIDLEAATMARVESLLREPQRSSLASHNMDLFAWSNTRSLSDVSSQGATDQIAEQWSGLYQLDPTQP